MSHPEWNLRELCRYDHAPRSASQKHWNALNLNTAVTAACTARTGLKAQLFFSPQTPGQDHRSGGRSAVDMKAGHP